jgi:hypothetical protein
MALVVKDRIQESSTTTGTGTLTLGGALTGFQSFSSAIGNGNTTYYAITLNGEWEVGIGTVGSGTLTRDNVLESSNSGSLVNFSAGTKNVFCTYPAEKSLYLDASGNSIALGTPASATLTNATGLPISTGISGLGTNVATFLATPSSANFASALTDETGSGKVVFDTSPTLSSATLNGNTTFDTNTLYVDSSNDRVGVGTTSPTYQLDVYNATNLEARLNGANASRLFISGSTYNWALNSNYYVAGKFTFHNVANNTDDIVIDNSGNVGINESSPSNKLDVRGAVGCVGNFKTNRATATNYYDGGGIQFQVDGTIYSAIAQPTAQALAFYTGNATTERMRIDSSGGIWSTNMDQGFQCRSGGNNYGGMYFSGGYLRFNTLQSGNSWMRFEHQGGGATEFRSGSNYNTNNVWGGLSDISLKENIIDVTPKLNDLLQVKIRQYNFKSDESKSKQIGVIAQEVEQIFPKIVDSDKDGILSVKYTVFIPMLIKAIQEQQEIIVNLKNRIEAIEGAN